MPTFGVFHNFAFISINKTYPQQARKVMSAIWGLGQLMFTKIIVVVDADVNVHDYDRVWFHVGSNVHPGRDVIFSEGPTDILDHAAPRTPHPRPLPANGERERVRGWASTPLANPRRRPSPPLAAGNVHHARNPRPRDAVLGGIRNWAESRPDVVKRRIASHDTHNRFT